MSKHPFPISTPSDFGFSEIQAQERAASIANRVAQMQQDRLNNKNSQPSTPGTAPLKRVF
jgi:hypothetical protein